MAKKEEKATFDLQAALAECPKPEWYKKAFCKIMDTSKIKSQADLNKMMKDFGGMK